MLIQDEAFLYNDDIKKGIKEMSLSTNILEKYDNVTYNASLYMYPYEVEQDINRKMGLDRESASYSSRALNKAEIDLTQYENKKVIIAQTGVTTKFSIKGFDIETSYGLYGSHDNAISFKVNLDLFESMSCLFANEMEIMAYLMGYKSYLLRPIWLDVWFSGYDTETLEPVSRIPLSNGDDRIIFKGVIGKAVSNIDAMGTNWKLEMYSSNITFEDKNKNILSRCPVIKSNANMTMNDYLKKLFKNMYERFKEQYPQKDIQARFPSIYPNGADSFIKFEVIDEEGNDIGDNIIAEVGNRDVDADGSSQEKNDPETSLSEVIQRFVSKSIDYKESLARLTPFPIYLESFGNINFYRHYITIMIKKDDYIKYAKEKYEDKEPSELLDNIQTKSFYKSRSTNTLVKKYIYGFSGEDTSVLSVDSSFDRMWYLNAFQLSATQQSSGSINIVAHNENDIKDIVNRVVKETSDILKGFSLKSLLDPDFYKKIANETLRKIKENQIKERKRIYNEEHPYAGYMEDIYEDLSENKNVIDSIRYIMSDRIVLNNDTDVETSKSGSSSDNPLESAEPNNAYNLYQGLYKTGQMVTTKITILGDPYWITPIGESRYSVKSKRNTENNFDDEIKSFYPNNEIYKFVFGIKSFINQSNDYETPYDYDLWEYSLNATGIYIIYNCKSSFQDGKFTQVLSGCLDTTLLEELYNKK